MGFRNPITTAADPTARAAAAAAQSTANSASSAASAAQTTANSALAVANGKNTTYISSSAPTAPAGGFTVGDQWIDTSHGNRLNVWQAGSPPAWVVQQWGSQALAAGSVVAGTVAAGAVDGLTITGATLRTAASGLHVQLDSSAADRMRMFTGDAGEVAPGVVQVAVALADPSGLTTGPKDRAVVTIQAPQLGSPLSVPVQMQIVSDTRDRTSPGYLVIGTFQLTTPAHEVLYTSTATYRTKYLASGVFGYDYFDATLRPPTVYLDALGMVNLSGHVGLDAAPTPGTLLATLPSTYRPGKSENFVCQGGNNRLWRCTVNAAGQVIFASAASSDWAFTAGTGTGAQYLSLSGVQFPSAALF